MKNRLVNKISPPVLLLQSKMIESNSFTQSYGDAIGYIALSLWLNGITHRPTNIISQKNKAADHTEKTERSIFEEYHPKKNKLWGIYFPI